MNTVKLPTTVEEFTAMTKIAIEHFSQSPVKNLNKLNESVAHALDVKNQDTLSSLKVKPAYNEAVIPAYLNNRKTFINHVEINSFIINEDLVPYKLIERLDAIGCMNSLLSQINERPKTLDPRRKGDIAQIKVGLEKLHGLCDKFVFLSTLSCESISPSVDKIRFNKICDDFTTQNNKLIKASMSKSNKAMTALVESDLGFHPKTLFINELSEQRAEIGFFHKLDIKDLSITRIEISFNFSTDENGLMTKAHIDIICMEGDHKELNKALNHCSGKVDELRTLVTEAFKNKGKTIDFGSKIWLG